jgi:hypothetical protein
MKKLLVKCIETFLIYIYIQLLKILNDMIVIKFIFESPFYIKFFNLLHEFFYQSYIWGYS